MIGVLLALLILLGAEGTLRAAGIGRPIEGANAAGGCWDQRAPSGRGLRPDCSETFRAYHEGRTILEASVTTDRAGRRTVPERAIADSQVVFLGCSFAWGWGLGDDATLPAVFQGLRPDTSVWNLAVPGQGPNDILVQLASDSLLTGLDRSLPTVGVYVSIPSHYGRLLGDPYYIDSWGRRRARFVLGKNGAIEERGVFGDARVQVFLARPLNRSFLLRAIRPWPRFFSEDRRRRTMAAALDEMRRRFVARFPRGELLVVDFPATFIGRAGNPSVLPAARDARLRTLDYAGLGFGPLVPGVDHHPDAPTVTQVARALARDLPRFRKRSETNPSDGAAVQRR
jgi:hypothetical protein